MCTKTPDWVFENSGIRRFWLILLHNDSVWAICVLVKGASSLTNALAGVGQQTGRSAIRPCVNETVSWSLLEVCP